jgi:hypothetical protein
MKGKPIIVEHNDLPMSLRELAETVGLSHHCVHSRYHRGKRGAELIAPITKAKPAGFIFFCKRCEAEFHRHARGYTYCSKLCANRDRGPEKRQVEPFARYGVSAKEASSALGIDPHTFRQALKRHGIYRAWQRRRFKKCASPKDGNSSVTTASETAITRSAA